MKATQILQTLATFVITAVITPSIANAQPNHLTHADLRTCLTDTAVYLKQKSGIRVDTVPAIPLEYLNSQVQSAYNTMRNEVLKHVTKKVALSFLDFNIDGFAAENIASYISNGTQPFLPFEFANKVKITNTTPRGRIVIYRTEVPVTKDHSQAKSLVLAGKIATTKTVCDDTEIMNNLLERDVGIQYDYYDSNGDFFSSFSING